MASYSPARPSYSWYSAKKAASSLLLPLGALVGLLNLVIFAASLTVPYLGADIAFREDTGWHVNRADEQGTAFRDSIRSGDQVTRVNGLTPDELAGGMSYIGAFRARSLEVVDASGTVKTSSANSGPVPSVTVQASIRLFTVGMAFWLTGFLSFLKRPGSKPVLFLYLMGLTISLGVVSGLGPPRGWELTRHTEVLGLALSPWLVARFFLEFPFEKRVPLLDTDITGLVYLPPVLTLLAYVTLARDDSAFYSWFRPLNLFNLASGFLLAFGIALHSYFTASFARFRQQIKIVAIGAAVGILPLVLFSILPEALGQGYILRPEITSLGFVALPLSLGYVILNHKLLDIDLAISRVLWYGLLTCALIASYMLLISFIESAAPGLAPGWRVLVLLTFTVTALFLSAPFREKLHRAVEARLNAGRYDYRQAAHQIIADLASQSELEEVTRLLAMGITRFLRLDGACVLLNTEDQGKAVSAAYGLFADYPLKQQDLLDWCQRLTEDQQFPNKAPLESGAAFFVPLLSGKKQLGMLALSSKISKPDFSVDDMYFLFSIKAQGSLAVDNAMLLKEAKTRAAELGTAFNKLQEYAASLEGSSKTLQQSYVGIIRTLVLAIESRSPYTKGHSERLTQLSRRIGAEMGLSSEELNSLQTAARIHDIGKIGIPDSILLKEGPLEHHERAEIELHPTKGVEIVRFLDFMRDAIPIIESHHEWVNGSGYPHGLRGQEIPLGARIVSVADAFDAMTSDRPYRRACSGQQALQKLQDGMGVQWDRTVVEALVRLPGLGHEDV